MDVVRRALILGAALAAGLAACGDESDVNDQQSQAAIAQREIRTTISRMGDRMAAADGPGACRYMTTSARREMAAGIKRLAQIDSSYATRGGDKGTCGAAFGAVLAGNFTEDVTPAIRSIRIDGRRAFVLGRVSHDKDNNGIQRAELSEEGGEWRVVRWFVHPGTAPGFSSASQ